MKKILLAITLNVVFCFASTYNYLSLLPPDSLHTTYYKADYLEKIGRLPDSLPEVLASFMDQKLQPEQHKSFHSQLIRHFPYLSGELQLYTYCRNLKFSSALDSTMHPKIVFGSSPHRGSAWDCWLQEALSLHFTQLEAGIAVLDSAAKDASLDSLLQGRILYTGAKLLQEHLQDSMAIVWYIRLLEKAPELRPQSDSAFFRIYYSSQKELMPNDFRWQLTWNRLLFRNGKLKEASESAQALLRRGPRAEIREELIARRASIFFTRQMYEDALTLYRQLWALNPTQPEYLLQIARCHRNAGRRGEATANYNLFVQRFPRHRKAAEIKWIEAYDDEQKNNHAAAIAKYRVFHKEFPGQNRQEWALFRSGLVFFKQKNYEHAIREWSQVIANTALLTSRNAAMFFTGEAYRLAGNDSMAIHWYARTRSDFPLSFYSVRAQSMMEQHFPSAMGGFPMFNIQNVGDSAVYAWLNTTEDSFSVDSQVVWKVRLLSWLGMREQARAAYEKIPARERNNLGHLFFFGRVFYDDARDYTFSYRLVRRIIWSVPRQNFIEPPSEIMRLVFPRPHYDVVHHYATEQGVPIALVYGLMRQESAFDESIRSSANAVGLMQIIPPTGWMLAHKENMPYFHPGLLANPITAIRLGIRYLGDIRNAGSNIIFTLATYNAGPGAARRWKNSIDPSDLNVLFEDISFWETRDYIKKVIANAFIYSLLDGSAFDYHHLEY
jgi:tetratricopeptide (TPR) repeat protein